MSPMTAPLTPATPAALAEAVRSHPRVLAVGARTKPRLSQVPDDVTLISTRALRGIVEYEPDEFTFTALAGTPVREIAPGAGGEGAIPALRSDVGGSRRHARRHGRRGRQRAGPLPLWRRARLHPGRPLRGRPAVGCSAWAARW